MYYFKSRSEAGKKLAEKLAKKQFKRPVIFCLSEGAVVVGAQIALRLRADMVLYKIKDIFLPNEHEATAALSSTGNFRYNDLLSAGQIEEIAGEFHNYMDEQRREKFHELNVLLGNDGEINKSVLHNRDIIVVADALPSGFAVSMAADYLKTVAIKKFVAAAAVVSVPALDHMHITSDELHVLGVAENFINVDHYFDDTKVPSTEEALKLIKNINYAWESGVGDQWLQMHSDAKAGRKKRFAKLKQWRAQHRGNDIVEHRHVLHRLRRRISRKVHARRARKAERTIQGYTKR
jgi:putative phosphoribosyl transferase